MHGFLHGIEKIMSHGHLDYFQKPPLGGRLTQNRETMALRMLTSVHLFYFYHVWGPTWIQIHWNSIWLRARPHMTSHYTWECVTTLHDFEGVLEPALGHFHLGSHHFVVTALGSCVKWPLYKPSRYANSQTVTHWPACARIPHDILFYF